LREQGTLQCIILILILLIIITNVELMLILRMVILGTIDANLKCIISPPWRLFSLMNCLHPSISTQEGPSSLFLHFNILCGLKILEGHNLSSKVIELLRCMGQSNQQSQNKHTLNKCQNNKREAKKVAVYE
jgi:hypothetical protein